MNASKYPCPPISELSGEGCPMDGLLKLLSGAWTTHVLWVIRTGGPSRFGQIRKQLPDASAKMLTERLRMLEETGILHRAVEASIPPKVTYSLTPRGKELENLLDTINKLAMKWSITKASKTKKSARR